LLFDKKADGPVLRYRGDGAVAVCIGWATVESTIAYGKCVDGEGMDED